MGYPADVTQVVVNGLFTAALPSTSIPTGYVEFWPNTVLVDAGTGQIVEAAVVVAALDGTGAISATLMATDDVHLSPGGWAYWVRETIDGYPRRVYQVKLPAAGSPFKLGALQPLSAPSTVGYVLQSQVGVANGVASLDGSGQVPLAQLGNVPGIQVPFTLLPYNLPGPVSVVTGAARIYNTAGRTLSLTKGILASVGTPPTGASLIVDVLKNGGSIFTTQPNRPTIAAGSNASGIVTNPDVTTWANGEYLTVNVAQVGSVVPGSDLTVQIWTA